MGRLAALMLVAVGFLAPVASANTEVDVDATGHVVVTWHGRAGECAPGSVCDVQGVRDIDVEGSTGFSESSGATTARSAPLWRLVGGATLSGEGTPRVLRGTQGACADDPGEIDFALVPRAGGRVGLAAPPYESSGSVLAGRCAGPLSDDLESALPSDLLTPAQRGARGHRLRFRLRLKRTSAFSAGPYEGTVATDVRASVRVHRWQPRRRARGARHRPQLASASLDFRVKAVSGSLAFGFGPGPACLALDACDLTGTVDLDPRLDRKGSTFTAFVTFPWPHRRHPTRADVLRLLRHGQGRAMRGAAQVLRWSGTQTAVLGTTAPCSQPLDPDDLLLASQTVAHGVQFLLRPEGDVVRTRCPGPDVSDLSAGDGLATETIPVRTLAQPAFALTLTPRAVAARSFSPSANGAVALQLEREHIGVAIGAPER